MPSLWTQQNVIAQQPNSVVVGSVRANFSGEADVFPQTMLPGTILEYNSLVGAYSGRGLTDYTGISNSPNLAILLEPLTFVDENEAKSAEVLVRDAVLRQGAELRYHFTLANAG